nr:retrovirus-related Pol polyprotein from transposon TNT 1-94 [Tanacetum cinerariifolium]
MLGIIAATLRVQDQRYWQGNDTSEKFVKFCVTQCQSGKVKVINGSMVVLSGTRRDNCIYSLDGHAVTDVGKAGSVWQEEYRIWVYILMFKHEAFGKSKEWKQLVGNWTGRMVMKLRTDKHQNGLAECVNRTLIDKVRYLLIQSGLLKTFWAEATSVEEDTHELLTYQKAVACEDSSKWKSAMEEEMDSLRKNNT